jgi:hypothetical protein
MTSPELIIWTKITNFQLDKTGDEFSFSDRVSRENGWTKSYTERVIQEYKKFIYLCCLSEKGVTPSDPVDQVWHLHLTYTKSYWIDFCQDTLGKQIHHNPTKGGKKEAQKFNGYYTHLQTLYKLHFDSEPPTDIWQPNEIRFSDIDFQRVNLKQYWLIKKPAGRFLSILTLFGIGIIGIISIQATDAVIPILLISIAVILGIAPRISDIRKKKKRKERDEKGKDGTSGCSGTGCLGHSTHHSSGSGHHSNDSGHDSGHSGCSGCSSSGCSGCGGSD